MVGKTCLHSLTPLNELPSNTPRIDSEPLFHGEGFKASIHITTCPYVANKVNRKSSGKISNEQIFMPVSTHAINKKRKTPFQESF